MNDLEQALAILQQPPSQALAKQAQDHLTTFFAPFQANLPSLLQLYEQEGPKLSPIARFYVLNQVVEATRDYDLYHSSAQGQQQQVHEWLHRMLRAQQLDGMYRAKYAVIYVHLLRNDFPEQWPGAFDELVGLMGVSQDIQVLKGYLKFVVQVLSTMDEELVERFDGTQHDKHHNQLAAKVKDGVRDLALGILTQLFTQVLDQRALFDQDSVSEVLRVSAQLIDWNVLDPFEPIIMQAKQILTQQRNVEALRVIKAVVYKGMDDAQKLQVISGLQLLDLVDSFQMGPTEEEEEEDFFAQLADCVYRVGEWTQQLYGHQEKLLHTQEQLQAYEQVHQRLIAAAVRLLNCERPRIGRHIIEYLSFFLQALKKQPALSEFDQSFLVQLLQVTVHRLTFPAWYKHSPKDQRTEQAEEWLAYREELAVNIFGNLCHLAQFNQTLLQAIAQLLSQLDPRNGLYQQGEVVLLLIFHIQQSIPGNMREKVEGNAYAELVQYMERVDFLAYNHRTVTVLYLENLIRYLPYVCKTPGFFMKLSGAFFSNRGLLSKDPELAHQCTFLLNRMVERFVAVGKPEDQSTVDFIAEGSMKVIELIHSGIPQLGCEDALSLYAILGLLVSTQNPLVSNELKRKLITIIYGAIYQSIGANQQDSDIVLWQLKYLNTFSKGFSSAQEIFQQMKEQFELILKAVLGVMGNNMKTPQICDQALQYLQKSITLIRGDALNYLQQITQLYLQSCEFERLDSILNVLSYTANQLKQECGPIMSQALPYFFSTIKQVQIPASNTSEVEKQMLGVFSAFNRLLQNCAESIEVRNLETQGAHLFDSTLANLLITAFERHPDKGFKKTVVIIFKSVIQQVTNIKHLRVAHVPTTCVAQLLGLSHSTLTKQTPEGQAATDISSLAPEHQAFIEAGLMVSVSNVFQLNPKVLDDSQIIKTLIDIQITLCMLGLGTHVKGLLAGAFPGPQKEEAAQALLQVVEQFCQGVVAKQGAPAPQLREVHEQYMGLLRQMKGQK